MVERRAVHGRCVAGGGGRIAGPPPRWKSLLAGLLLAAAAWATPSFVIPLALIGGAVVAMRGPRRSMLAMFAAGHPRHQHPRGHLALVSLGALGPMLDSLVWASSRYAQANTLPYGYYPGGIPFLRPDLSALTRVWSAAITLRTLLPIAGLPVMVAVMLWQTIRRPRPATVILSLAAAGFVLTAYPRWDSNQLLYVAPLLFAIGAVWVARLPDLTASTVAVVFCFAGHSPNWRRGRPAMFSSSGFLRSKS